jgi:hypothetical protein
MKDLSDACTEIENSLPLWVGADLEPAAQQEVEEHLARCSRCAEKAAATRLSRMRLLEGLDLQRRTIGEGPDPWPSIRAALRSEGRLLGDRLLLGPWHRHFPLRTAAAAAVLIGLVFAWTRLSPISLTGSLTGSTTAPGLTQMHPSPSPAPANSAPVAAQPVGLHHLQPGEHLLRESALFYDPVTPDDGAAGRSRYQGSTVGLERPLPTPPR